jgi:hypothetical protein
MTTRIQLILAQARSQVRQDLEYSPDALLPQELVDEKFALLIAQECMGLCAETQAEYLKHRQATSDSDEKIIYAEGEAACDVVRHKIKRHFGVEE